MDNRDKAFGGQSAKEMTAEIDRAAEEMAVQQGEMGVRASEMAGMPVGQAQGEMLRSDRPELARMSNRQAQEMGAVILAEDRFQRGRGNDLRQAEAELARDEREISHPEQYVGEESKIQQDVYRQLDNEDLRNEEGRGLSFENKIAADSEKEVLYEVGVKVGKIISMPVFAPSKVEQVYRRGVNKMLGKAYNRSIGERNNAA